jgi:o-succinylbenzoate synthase
MSLTCHQYQLPFKKPLTTSKGTFEHREGLILAFRGHSQSFFSEAAPLPGFSNERLSEVVNQAKSLRSDITEVLTDKYPVNELIPLLNEQNLAPSLEFALEALAYQVEAHQNELSLQQQLFSKSISDIQLNALGSLRSSTFIADTQALVDQGFETVKFKVGINVEDELWRLKKIRDHFPELSIRLDANQAWSPIAAKHYCHELEQLSIAYCEEPLSEPTAANYEFLYANTSIPLALDETVSQDKLWQELLPYSSAVIIKPMLVGGFAKNLETKHLAETHNNTTVFTTSLESGIGRWLTANLASGSDNRQTAHGLSTGSLLDNDVYPDNCYISNGIYHLDSQDPLKVDMNQLQSVSSRIF